MQRQLLSVTNDRCREIKSNAPIHSKFFRQISVVATVRADRTLPWQEFWWLPNTSLIKITVL